MGKRHCIAKAHCGIGHALRAVAFQLGSSHDRTAPVKLRVQVRAQKVPLHQRHQYDHEMLQGRKRGTGHKACFAFHNQVTQQ